jgi:hypothetical protein
MPFSRKSSQTVGRTQFRWKTAVYHSGFIVWQLVILSLRDMFTLSLLPMTDQKQYRGKASKRKKSKGFEILSIFIPA